MRASKIVVPVLFGALLLAMWFPVAAQDKSAKDRDSLNRLQRTVAKLQQENAALVREKGELAAKLASNEKELEGIKGDAVRSRQRAAAGEKEHGVLKQELVVLKQKLDVSEKQSSQLGVELKEGHLARQRIEADRDAIGVRFKRETAALNACVAANDKLYVLSRELMKEYEKAAIDRVDPVFGLRMVEIESNAQLYRDRADESRIPRERR